MLDDMNRSYLVFIGYYYYDLLQVGIEVVVISAFIGKLISKEIY